MRPFKPRDCSTITAKNSSELLLVKSRFPSMDAQIVAGVSIHLSLVNVEFDLFFQNRNWLSVWIDGQSCGDYKFWHGFLGTTNYAGTHEPKDQGIYPNYTCAEAVHRLCTPQISRKHSLLAHTRMPFY